MYTIFPSLYLGLQGMWPNKDFFSCTFYNMSYNNNTIT